MLEVRVRCRSTEWTSDRRDPHELILGRDGQSLSIVNHGIDLHPDNGRQILSEGPIGSSLVRLDLSGRIADKWPVAGDIASLSLRHMAELPDGSLMVGCQEQGDFEAGRPLLVRFAGSAAP